MKRIISSVLAASMILSLVACSEGNTDNSSAGTGSFATNPVKLDENGDIDMEAALAYETDIDAFLAKLEAAQPDGSKPVSENSNEETLELFNYLRSIYGKQMLSGQQYSDTNQYEDLVYYTETGDLPAIKGFDMLYSHGTDEPDDRQIEEAIKWHTEQNGIVAFCWHWRVPVDIDDETTLGTAFYSEEIRNFSLENAVTPGTKEYQVIIRDIDLIALKLQMLEKAGVPVLWRPLHEASGAWFWWGVKDKETAEKQLYQKLWYMVYDRLENYHKLTNLIWVWNGQAKKAIVNANTFDIAGFDIYPTAVDHSAQETKYNTLVSLAGEEKMMAISECGYIPDDKLVFAEDSNVKWLYFMPWCGEFICNATSTGAIITKLGGTPTVNENRITSELLQQVYFSENVVTLSELQEFPGTTKKLPNHIVMWQLNNPSIVIENSKLEAYDDTLAS